MIYYELINDNPFYGKAGTRIYKTIYDKLPEKHQKELFREVNKSLFDKYVSVSPSIESQPIKRNPNPNKDPWLKLMEEAMERAGMKAKVRDVNEEWAAADLWDEDDDHEEYEEDDEEF